MSLAPTKLALSSVCEYRHSDLNSRKQGTKCVEYTGHWLDSYAIDCQSL